MGAAAKLCRSKGSLGGGGGEGALMVTPKSNVQSLTVRHFDVNDLLIFCEPTADNQPVCARVQGADALLIHDLATLGLGGPIPETMRKVFAGFRFLN